MKLLIPHLCSFFFFNDTATTEIYTLSLHDALPIFPMDKDLPWLPWDGRLGVDSDYPTNPEGDTLRSSALRAIRKDRKSTRLNSSHSQISYAVFCLKKKKKYIVLFAYMKTT